MDKQARFNQIKEELTWYGISAVSLLGSGGFGDVVLAVRDGNSFAIKCFTKAQIQKHPELSRYIKNEYKVMRAIQHENVLKQEYNIEGKNHFFMVLEYCNDGNLLKLQSTKQGKVFAFDEAMHIAFSILNGLREIHSKKFIHRDIKPENILIHKENGQTFYKIGDFGFARPVENNSAETHCGTTFYMAPEILAGRPYGKKVDYWSLGVLMFFMLFGQYPFKSMTKQLEIERKCSKGYDLKKQMASKKHWFDEETFNNLTDFFKRIFVINPDKRMSSSDVINHPIFYNQIDQQNCNLDKNFSTLESSTSSNNSDTCPYEDEQNYMNLERQKVLFLKQQLARLATTYKMDLNGIDKRDIWATSYYILKAIVFFTKSAHLSLVTRRKPHHSLRYWSHFCDSVYADAWKQKLQNNLNQWEKQMREYYFQVESVGINIKGFRDSLTPVADEQSFNEFKNSYRLSISNLFKQVHKDFIMAPELKLRIELELFCCHTINRVFEPKNLELNFSTYKHNKKFHHATFLEWVNQQNRFTLENTINALNSRYNESR